MAPEMGNTRSSTTDRRFRWPVSGEGNMAMTAGRLFTAAMALPVFGAAAVAQQKTEPPKAPPAKAEPQKTAPPAKSEPAAAQGQTLRVVTRVLPPMVVDQQGKLTGFSIDLWD